MFQQQKIDRSQLQRADEFRSTAHELAAHELAEEMTLRDGTLWDGTHGELTVDELFADPIMPALWRAHGITEGDVRRAVADATARLKARGTTRHPSPRCQLACA